MRVWMCLFMLWCLGLQPALAEDRDYGRSMVVTVRGIVATSQVLASQAGAHILERGGSAIDAAIAANAVLDVTEPMMNGIGGDLFLLYWDAKSGKLYGLNASGWAPQGLQASLPHHHSSLDGTGTGSASQFRSRHEFCCL